MTEWITIGPLKDIPRLGARVVKTAEGNIAVFRTATDELFAVFDRCPHKGGPLSEGLVYGRRVACPLHNWSIDLQSGEAIEPDTGCARTFPVRVQQGIVQLAVEL